MIVSTCSNLRGKPRLKKSQYSRGCSIYASGENGDEIGEAHAEGRIFETKTGEVVNYEPRETLCRPACVQGKKLKVPVYIFLKEALIRKYGEKFYQALTEVAETYFAEKAEKNKS